MGFVARHILSFLLMGLLLVVSGLFSGSETVLFSLTRHDRARMKKSGRRLEMLAAQLLDNPRSLLTTLMIGNMGCNILFFVLSTMLLAGNGEEAQAGAAGRSPWHRAVLVLLAVVPPLLVTYVSDVLPKVIGAMNNKRIAPLIALPIATLVRLLRPVSLAIDWIFIRPVHRIVTGGRPGTRRGADYSADELRELLEMSQEQGVIDVSENELLQEVVRIGELKVRDVMTPRVDMVAFNLQGPPEKLLERFAQSHLAKLPVYDGSTDNVVGLVYAKEVLLESTDPAAAGRKLDIRRLVRPVQFVPEILTLERLIARFRATKTQLAVVVDEFGGVVGVVALEDVVEQMVGDIYEPHDRPVSTTQKIGPDEYRVAGDLSVADWMEAFGEPLGQDGVPVDLGRVSTVAGLMAAALKRVPKVGDQVRLGHLKMTIESMRGRRVEQVRMQLVDEPAAAGRGA